MSTEESSQIGAMALVALKNQSKALNIFKKPAAPVEKKKDKRKQVILSEEKYMIELSKIIQRDFFPDLEKLKAQNEYLDAIASNNVVKLREIYTKYSSRRRPTFNDTPMTFETPLTQPNATPGGHSTTSQKSHTSTRSLSDNHSLDSFLSTYTSEDDQSFEEIVEAADLRLKQRFAILYEAEDSSSQLLKNALALPSLESQFESTERTNKLDTWTYKNKNYIMYIPDGVDFTPEEKIEMAKRRQEICHSSTRLTENPFNDSQNKETICELAKSQARCNAEKIGLDGKTVENSDTPLVRGFSFIRSPSPCPSLIDSSPLMTWGEIEGTPFRLDGSDTPMRSSSLGGPSFRIAETSKRETLAHQLAENVSEKHRAKKSKAIEAAKKNMCASPHMRSSLDRLASLSPAARRLSSVRLGLARESWATPSPKPKHGSIVTPKRLKNTSLIKGTTPLRTPSTPSSFSETTLTDNLLDIPSSKRPKASDFF